MLGQKHTTLYIYIRWQIIIMTVLLLFWKLQSLAPKHVESRFNAAYKAEEEDVQWMLNT